MPVGRQPGSPREDPSPGGPKPTVEELGIDVRAQTWYRSGGRDGSIEVAFVGMAPRGEQAGQSAGSPSAPSRLAAAGGEWVLMRVAGDPAGRVLVYDRFEWECFLDGARNGEFDDAAAANPPPSDHY